MTHMAAQRATALASVRTELVRCSGRPRTDDIVSVGFEVRIIAAYAAQD